MYSIYFSPVPQATPVSNTIAVWCLLEESFFFFLFTGLPHLCTVLMQKRFYGRIPTRLWLAFKQQKAGRSRLEKHCGFGSI